MEKCGFVRSRYVNIMTVSYPTGHIGMLLGEKNPLAASEDDAIMERYKRIVKSGGRTSYYHPVLQRGYVCNRFVTSGVFIKT